MSFSNVSDISLFTFNFQIRYPDRTKLHAIFSLFLRKCLASREAVVSINLVTWPSPKADVFLLAPLDEIQNL